MSARPPGSGSDISTGVIRSGFPDAGEQPRQLRAVVGDQRGSSGG
ncbi:MAG: hypothetical protein U0521_25005 [Anaerolineae bacterium]